MFKNHSYIIGETSKITAYACNSIALKPGFHTQNGSKFHAFIGCSPCIKSTSANLYEEEIDKIPLVSPTEENETSIVSPAVSKQLKVFPNPSQKGFTIEFSKPEGEYLIVNIKGEVYRRESVKTSTLQLTPPKGIYIIKWIHQTGVETQKMIAL